MRRIYDATEAHEAPPPDLYETPDTAIASYLLAEGMPLESTRVDGRSVKFLFGEAEKCRRLQAAWWTGQDALTSARAYADAYTRLRRLAHELSRSS